MKKIKDKIVSLFSKNKPSKYIVTVDPATNNMSTFKVENGITEQIKYEDYGCGPACYEPGGHLNKTIDYSEYVKKQMEQEDYKKYVKDNTGFSKKMKIAAQIIGLDLVATKPAPMKQEDYDYLIEKHERNNMVITPVTNGTDPGHSHMLMLDPSHPDYWRSTYEGPKTMKFTIPVNGLTPKQIDKTKKTLNEIMNYYDNKLLEVLNEPYTYTDTKEYKDSNGTINTLHDISNNQLAYNHDDIISQMKRAKQRNEDVVNEIVAKHDALLNSLKKKK
jgi:hypothetical protein